MPKRERTHLGNSDDVESDSLGERSALSNSDVVSDLDSEGGRAVGGKVSVSLLVPRVLGDEVEVVSSDDDGSGHLAGRDDLSSEDSASDGDVTSERALLVWRAPGRRRERERRGNGGGEGAAEEVTKRSEPIEDKEVEERAVRG